MKLPHMPETGIQRRHQRGFNLVELMVSITIGLFLIGGLLTLVQAMKRTTISQNGLSQLQDSERMAMSLITDVIQSSGYFISPLNQSATSSFQVVGSYTYPGPPAASTDAFSSSGQALAGSTPPATGDQITSRYWTSGIDKVINCTGNTYTASSAVFVNTFSIDANGNLQCLLVINGNVKALVPLIGGIQSMKIQYGVVTNTSVNTNSVDAYLPASSVPNWNAVKSVKVTLNFVNPLSGTPGQKATISFTRVIAVMSNT